MKKELTVGIIGTGWPGQQHAIALAEIPDVQLHSCADTNSERLRSFAETYRLESSFEDYQELLRDCDLDAAIICLPNFLHSRRPWRRWKRASTSFARNPRR
jgi:predicted dehydrogenase